MPFNYFTFSYVEASQRLFHSSQLRITMISTLESVYDVKQNVLSMTEGFLQFIKDLKETNSRVRSSFFFPPGCCWYGALFFGLQIIIQTRI